MGESLCPFTSPYIYRGITLSIYVTLEFLNSYSYVTNLASQGSIETIRFRMFNRDYEFSQNQIVALLLFSHDAGITCKVPQ